MRSGAHYMLVRVRVRVRFGKEFFVRILGKEFFVRILGKEFFVRILFERTRIRTFGRGITRFIRMRIL